jgi:hypothetical protein
LWALSRVEFLSGCRLFFDLVTLAVAISWIQAGNEEAKFCRPSNLKTVTRFWVIGASAQALHSARVRHSISWVHLEFP